MRSSVLLARLDARDRALFVRWSAAEHASRKAKLFWTIITHLGGATCSLMAAVLPLGGSGPLAFAARQAVVALVVSHVAVQFVKRVIGRPRPSRTVGCVSLAREPDRFSFPSGHSAAAMSVAVVYALAFPQFAPLLIPAAALVGASRVFLGVHYPGDVLIGQLIAVLAAIPIVYG